jgi:hypothetical protein
LYFILEGADFASFTGAAADFVGAAKPFAGAADDTVDTLASG